MMICLNNNDPTRNDEYGRDGYTACCLTDNVQIGKYDYFTPIPNQLPNPKKGKIMNKLQYLLCYQCGKNINGEMRICVNECDPERDDKFGVDGYTACCPNCVKHIGKESYFQYQYFDESFSIDRSRSLSFDYFGNNFEVYDSSESSETSEEMESKEEDKKCEIEVEVGEK